MFCADTVIICDFSCCFMNAVCVCLRLCVQANVRRSVSEKMSRSGWKLQRHQVYWDVPWHGVPQCEFMEPSLRFFYSVGWRHYCTALYCITIHYSVLHCTALHTSLYYSVLHCTTLHYTTMHCTGLHYTTVYYTTLRYTTLDYTAL